LLSRAAQIRADRQESEGIARIGRAQSVEFPSISARFCARVGSLRLLAVSRQFLVADERPVAILVLNYQ
jgi:hypothetical protein